MARCSAEAERFSMTTGVLTRIIGWYHSHPHITVHPSHVDVRTQVSTPTSQAKLPTPAAVHDECHGRVLSSSLCFCRQANYQMMDSGFVGLIFSTFNEVHSHLKPTRPTHGTYVGSISP